MKRGDRAPRLVALLALAVLLPMAPGCGRRDRGAEATRVAGVDLAAEELRLAGFQPVANTGFLYAPLVPAGWYTSYESSGRGEAKDLLFFDTATKSAHWLLGDPDRTLRFYALIEHPSPAPRDARSGPPEDRRVLGVLFETAPDPPPQDPSARSTSIGMAEPDGRYPKSLLDGTSGLLGHHLVGPDSLIVFYVREDELWAADVDPTTRTILSDARVSAAP
jgi:hypothetical protein